MHGITLIALVVTIVVLLILAGVTITTVLGDDGIIEKAKEAAELTNNAINNEQSNVTSIVNELQDMLGGSGGGTQTPSPEISKEELERAFQDFKANPNKYVHDEQSLGNKDRAIGTDGKAVNLDLWNYYMTADGTGISLGQINNGSDGYVRI